MACKKFTTKGYLVMMTTFRDEMEKCRESFNKRLDQLEKQRSGHPIVHPAVHPIVHLAVHPIDHPTVHPTVHPSTHPTVHPSAHVTDHPTVHPIDHPNVHPTVHPSTHPTVHPSAHVTDHPSVHPIVQPIVHPIVQPTVHPTVHPSTHPTVCPSNALTVQPSSPPTVHPFQSDPDSPSDGPLIPIITDPPRTRSPTRNDQDQFNLVVQDIIEQTTQIRSSQPEPPRSADSAPPILEPAEGYSAITTSEWQLPPTGKETFLFHISAT